MVEYTIDNNYNLVVDLRTLITNKEWLAQVEAAAKLSDCAPKDH